MRTALILHLLGASIWVGGHLTLLFAVLPGVLRNRDVGMLRSFEQRYERIGLPALLVQLITGLWLAHQHVPGIIQAFSFPGRGHAWGAVKLLLMAATVVTGAHARLFIIPRLSAERLTALAVHIVVINILGLAMLLIGAVIRTGG